MYKLLLNDNGSFTFVPHFEGQIPTEQCQTFPCIVSVFHKGSNIPSQRYETELAYSSLSHYFNSRLISITFQGRVHIRIYGD